MALDGQEATFRPTPRRILAFLLTAVCCATVGVALILDRHFAGWPALCLGVALAAFAVWWHFSLRMRLKLNRDGFFFGTVTKQYYYRWSDIAWFGVADIGGGPMTIFTFIPGYQGEERVRAINQQDCGYDRFFPDTYGMTAEKLAELLESWRHRSELRWN